MHQASRILPEPRGSRRAAEAREALAVDDDQERRISLPLLDEGRKGLLA
jgi:hypothetical protein